MKTLIATLILLSSFAYAEEQNPHKFTPDADPSKQVIPLPFQIQCIPIPPYELLKDQYGEIGFVEGLGHLIKPDGSQADGKLRMFVDPGDDKSYSIFIELGTFSCMVMSGVHLRPMVAEEGPGI